jgi:Fe2+ or Zn2+ uptake regulation protein
MIKYENNCCNCSIFCSDCGKKKQPVLICDKCGDRVDDLYDVDGEELCEICALKALPKVEIGE